MCDLAWIRTSILAHMELHALNWGVKSVEVISTRTKEPPSGRGGLFSFHKPYTVYTLQVTLNSGLKHTVDRRFSQFDNLRNHLTRILAKVPGLPAKTFGGSTKPEVVEARKKLLAQWLAQLLGMAAVQNARSFWDFLDILKSRQQDAKQPAPSAFLPERVKIKSIRDDDFVFGVTQFCLDAGDRTLFMVYRDSYVLSRLDSRLTNAVLEFAKKPSSEKVPLGAFTVWRTNSELTETK
eukprot:g31007.t1